MSAGEVDFDDLTILRTWREYEPKAPGEVRYFMYQLVQRDAGQSQGVGFYKAVRFLRVTRVPRYLRQINTSASGSIFAHHRKLLAGLREQQVLFTNLIAKSPQLPLVFAYGVQAVGRTPEDARAAADRSFAVLCTLVDGVYQQLEYAPLKVEEAELLVRYQSEWDRLAMARGRPKPLGTDAGSDAWLDGNRTDVENNQNMLESFIRGMGERSFLLSTITVPISPIDMSYVWRNLSRQLSRVRSEQSGARAINAGLAIPLTMSGAEGHTGGNSHTTGDTWGHGASDGVSRADTYGISAGETHGVSSSLAHSDTVSHSVGTSHGISDSVGHAHSEATTAQIGESANTALGENVGVSSSASEGVNFGTSEGVSLAESTQHSTSVAHGHTAGVSDTISTSQSLAHGVSTGQSLGESLSVGRNWGSSVSDTTTAGVSNSSGVSGSTASGVTHGFSLADMLSRGVGDSSGQSSGAGISGGLIGFNGAFNDGQSIGFSRDAGWSNTIGQSLSSTGTITHGFSDAFSNSLSRGVTLGESLGASETAGRTATNSVGESLTASNGVTQSAGRTLAESQTLALAEARGFSHGVNQGVTSGVNASHANGISSGASLSHGAGVSTALGASSADTISAGRSVSTGTNETAGVSQGRTLTDGVSASRTSTETVSGTDATAQSVMANRALSDSYTAALSKSMTNTTALGIVPTAGISVSRNTFDEGKRVIGDLLEAQMQRYLEGVESGAFLYQMFLVCADDETLAGAAGLLKSSFWGPGDNQRLPQPFQVSIIEDREEARRLLTHAAAFTSYRKRERSMDLVEPYLWSSYLTPGEGAAMTHPPTAEALGLQASQDSMPVFAMPYDRADRDVYLGHVMNGERARPTNQPYGINLEELTHTLVAGTTGSGKTTMLRRFLFEATRRTRTVTDVTTTGPGAGVKRREVPAGALVLDWARSFRGMAALVDEDRFRFFSVTNPTLGEFRFNPLAVPDEALSVHEWANTISDLFMIAYNLGDFARSIFYELLWDLYNINRLEDAELRPAEVDPDTGEVLRAPIILPAIDEAHIRPECIITDPATGRRLASVLTCPELSRCIGIEHLTVLLASRMEANAKGGDKLSGRSMADRYQTVWRRLMPFEVRGALYRLFGHDATPGDHNCVRVDDLIDPERGLVTVVEADGLDHVNRKFVLGCVLMSTWRWAQGRGEGSCDQGGRGPGTFIILEEAHELFGSQEGEDRDTAAARVALYETLFRRARQYGLKLVAAVQNPAHIPDAVLGNVGAVVCHQLSGDKDKDAIAGLFNWMKAIGQHFREIRYLGEMAIGDCVVRLKSRDHFLQATPVHIRIDAPSFPTVDDDTLARLEARRAAKASAAHST